MKKPTRKTKKRTRRPSRFSLLPLGLRRRKEVIAEALGHAVDNTPAIAQLEMAEHIVQVGLEQIGRVLDMDTSSAIVMFPEDAEVDLIRAAIRHSEREGLKFEDVVAGIIKSLSPVMRPVVN